VRGGPREGSGRPKGARTKKSSQIAERAAKEGKTPLEFMLEIMRNDSCPENADPAAFHAMRFEAAKAAAPYIHPRLASQTIRGPGEDGEHRMVLTAPWMEMIAKARGWV